MEWDKEYDQIKRQGVDLDEPGISVEKTKKRWRYDDMVSESREMMEEMNKGEW